MDYTEGKRAIATWAQCGLGVNDCKCNRGQRFNGLSNTEELVIIIFGHPADNRPTLLIFCERTPSVLSAGLLRSKSFEYKSYYIQTFVCVKL
jgi:hypothetical protein